MPPRPPAITGTGAPVQASAPSTEHGPGRGVLTAPAAWYTRPETDGYTRLTVTDDGEVYGHIAPWGASHRGTGVGSDLVRGDDFSAFHTGVVRTAEGSDLDVGALTIGGGHASLDATPTAAAEHYDDVATAWAHVRASNGQHGIWVAGSVAPGVTDLMLHKARAFPPSGDWRWIDGQYRMVACCQVVTPGFPVPQQMRAQIAAGLPAPLVASTSDWNAPVTAAGDYPDLGGPGFRILVAPESDPAAPAGREQSRDGRSIDYDALEWGDGPWPLWQSLRETHGGEETEGTILVGRIDGFERDNAHVVWATGAFDTSPEAVEAARLVGNGMLLGASADLGEMRGTYLGGEIEMWDDGIEIDEVAGTIVVPDEPFDSAEPWMTVQYGELLGVTLVGKPTFRQSQVELTGDAPAATDGATVTPIAAAMRAALSGRQRVRPFRVVGRPAKAPAALTVDEQLSSLRDVVVEQGRRIDALTAALARPVAVAAALETLAAEKARARLTR